MTTNTHCSHSRKNRTKDVIPTGFTGFDRKIGGLRRGSLVVIAARHGEGKTSLALNIATNVALHAKEPRAVGIFSLELPKKALMMRMLSSESRVDAPDLRSGFYSRDRWTKITATLDRLTEAPLFFDDEAALSVRQIGARARKLAVQMRSEGKSLGLIIIDGLQSISQARGRKGRDESLLALKRLAKTLDVPIMVLSRIPSRPDPENHLQALLQLSSLRRSNTPDLVARLHRPDGYRHGHEAKLIIAGQGDGSTAIVPLTFDRRHVRFEHAGIRRN